MNDHQPKKLWRKIIESRFLAGTGVIVLILVSGFGITRVASAQSTNYLIPAVTWNSIQQQLRDLANRVTSLESQMRVVQSVNPPRPVVQPVDTNVVTGNPAYSYTYSYPSYPPNYSNTTYTNYTAPTQNQTSAPTAVIIDQNGGSYVAGFGIFITGRGFMPNEQVLISRNGIVVGHATVDGGGSFSTNGLPLPLGPSTFIFTGQTSGISAVANINGVRSVTP